MGKILALGTLLIILASNNIFADTKTELDIGKIIYDRAFGRGCGACHDIESNPQIFDLIQANQIDIVTFTDVIKNGKNSMPEAITSIMEIGAVKNAGYTEAQAIHAIYRYLGEKR